MRRETEGEDKESGAGERDRKKLGGGFDRGVLCTGCALTHTLHFPEQFSVTSSVFQEKAGFLVGDISEMLSVSSEKREFGS